MIAHLLTPEVKAGHMQSVVTLLPTGHTKILKASTVRQIGLWNQHTL